MAMNEVVITLTMDQIAQAVEFYLNHQILGQWKVDDYQCFPAKSPREIKFFLKEKVEKKDGTT